MGRHQIARLYGITKDPETKDYMLVMEYLDGGDFRSKLETTFKNYEWEEKIRMLWFLASGLDSIHSVGYTHRDLHGGNILFRSGTAGFPCILDFGLYPLNSKLLYGILPYIAPEILDGEPFSPAADIYSFGIIMTELATGKLAFHDRPHDKDLAIKICNGLRPDIGKGTPQFYINLAKECLSGDPLRRPTANTLVKFLDFCDRAFKKGNRNDDEVEGKYSNYNIFITIPFIHSFFLNRNYDTGEIIIE